MTIKFRGINRAVIGDQIEIDEVAVIDWMHDEVYFMHGTDVATPIEAACLMQFTGLTDINGKEIYADDIVKVHRDPKYVLSTDHVGRVISNNGSFVLEKGFNTAIRSNIRFTEVIGNIHQNPELLTKPNILTDHCYVAGGK